MFCFCFRSADMDCICCCWRLVVAWRVEGLISSSCSRKFWSRVRLFLASTTWAESSSSCSLDRRRCRSTEDFSRLSWRTSFSSANIFFWYTWFWCSIFSFQLRMPYCCFVGFAVTLLVLVCLSVWPEADSSSVGWKATDLDVGAVPVLVVVVLWIRRPNANWGFAGFWCTSAVETAVDGRGLNRMTWLRIPEWWFERHLLFSCNRDTCGHGFMIVVLHSITVMTRTPMIFFVSR